MLEPFEYRGLWWLPEEPAQKVAGVLTFSQDDVALELVGQLPRTEARQEQTTDVVVLPAGPLSRERIVGLSTNGKAFTLERCHASGWNMSMPGMATERFSPDLILEGARYETGEAVVFDELSVRYTQLDGWVATSGISSGAHAEGEEVTGIDLSFRPPDSIEVELPDLTLEVAFSWTPEDAAPLGTQLKLSQRAAFVLRFEEPMPLEQTLDFVYQLRNFVALGVGRPVTPVAITGFVLPPANAERDPFTGLEPRKLTINLFYRLGHVPDVKDIHPAQMLFTFPDARDRLTQLLENWFCKQQLLRPVFDLYFGAIYNRHAFLEQRFLSLMQAIETYHRRTSTETDLPPEKHERRLEEILAATPEEYRHWLSGQLTHSNELTLRKRLKDVLRRCPDVVEKLVKKKRFIHRVHNARNYLTHYDSSLEDKAQRGMNLYPLTVQLQALVEMCLLLELGFNCEEVNAFFDRVERYREANA
jgi:hypothetical protein